MWTLLEPVFRAGETFRHGPSITEQDARLAWVEQSQTVMVAADTAGALAGNYQLRPNPLALGAQVANAGCVVAELARRGKAAQLGSQEHDALAQQYGETLAEVLALAEVLEDWGSPL